VLSYRSTIPLSTATLQHAATVLRRHRARIGCRWRRLSCSRQALLVLAHLRNGDTYTRLAAGFRIGVATAWRYVREAVDLLAAHAPSLTAALWRLVAPHGPTAPGDGFGICDGTVIRINRQRGPADRPHYSSKHRHHGITPQAVCDPRGRPIWLSPGLPAGTQDLTAARTHRIPDTAAAAGIVLLADKAYTSPHPEFITPYKIRANADSHRRLTRGETVANRAHASLRVRGEHGFAALKTWHILHRYRGRPHRVGPTAHAILTLHHGPEN
jgi:hypothetical protein